MTSFIMLFRYLARVVEMSRSNLASSGSAPLSLLTLSWGFVGSVYLLYNADIKSVHPTLYSLPSPYIPHICR